VVDLLVINCFGNLTPTDLRPATPLQFGEGKDKS